MSPPGFCKKCRKGRSRSTATHYPWRSYGGDWRKISKAKLERDPLCQCRGVIALPDGTTEECGSRCCHGRKPAREVDHVLELQDGGSHADENLLSKCASCHRRKTRVLKRWRERRARGVNR
jgi:hypothetical protein